MDTVPEIVLPYVRHIRGWQSQIRGEVIAILVKLHRDEALSDDEHSLEISQNEVAAIWTWRRGETSPDLVRQMKRLGHLKYSQKWGEGMHARYLYRVSDVLNVEIKPRGRPRKQRNAEE